MFDAAINLILAIIGLALLIPGTVMLLYGLISITISDFDKSVRVVSIIGGIILSTIGLYLLLNL